MSGKMPIEINLIECLYADGEVPVVIMVQMGGKHAWVAADKLVREGVATLWVKGDGQDRRLLDWECDAVVRSRLRGSTEKTPKDGSLTLKATDRIAKVYQERFGAWYTSMLDGMGSDG